MTASLRRVSPANVRRAHERLPARGSAMQGRAFSGCAAFRFRAGWKAKASNRSREMATDHNEKQGLGPVIIMGGGPAGLTAAYELCRSGVPSIVLEQGAMVGGLAKTVDYKGYRFDLGGHRFFTRIDRVRSMWEDLLGSDLLVCPRLSRILYRGRFFYYPLRPLDVFLGLGPWSCVGFLLSYARARLWRVEPERTFEDWVSNRFGRKLYQAFFKTYTEKVLGIPCADIAAAWAARRIHGLSLSVAIKESLFESRSRTTVDTLIDRFHYPRFGPGMLWQGVAERIARLGGEVRCEHSVTRIHWSGDDITAVGVRTADGREERVSGPHFVSSIAMRDIIRAMSPPAPPEVRTAAESLGYRDLIVVALIVDRAHIFADNWIYIHDDNLRVGRIQNFKNWSPEMVPNPAKSCLGLEYFCSQGDDLWQSSDADLVALATAELEQAGLAECADVIDGTVVKVPQAYPMYDTGYRSHVDTVRGFLSRFRNLQLIGRNGLHKYINQDHAMVSALLAVENLLGAAHEISDASADDGYLEEAAALSRL
jgi:protoporphyrinogen oxidase